MFLNEEQMMQLAKLSKSEKPTSNLPRDKTSDSLPHALIVMGLVSIVFAALPELDLMTSRHFWDAANGFYGRESPLLTALRDINRYLPWILIGIATVLLIANNLKADMKRLAPPHKLLFLITFFALGPGLSVQAVKAVVGRARPRALEEFGGSAIFTPAWDFSDQCIRNCSFVSGEAASAFALMALIVFVKPRYATYWMVGIGVFAAAFSFNRVAFGAHFLSDVIIAGNLMWIVAILLWRWFSRNASQIDAILSRR
jgi:membrane-associated PAP2 superfamily phosphatase